MLAALLLLVPLASKAADNREIGMIVDRVDHGFWVLFAHPVREGQTVRIRAHREGEDVGTARIQWAAIAAPYEAFIVDAAASSSIRTRTSSYTPYMRLVGERPPGELDNRETIVPGYYVVASSGSVPETADGISATLDMLRANEEAQGLVRDLRIAAAEFLDDSADVERVSGILHRYRFHHWNSPITARLVARLTDQIRARYGTAGRLPGGGFPPDLAKQHTTGQNPAGAGAGGSYP
jgi:hypothetical protein